MQIQAPDPAAAHLHRGEVGVAGEGERRQLLSGRGLLIAVDDEGRGHAWAPGNLGTLGKLEKLVKIRKQKTRTMEYPLPIATLWPHTGGKVK
ncbi:hypothetical protein [Streptomyces sp. 6N223]|uniref:hypothetical protein n=1 Tax=Streptomyces sp. 6N223 TaxID=3457412 RepID=UPI003FD3D578